MTLDYGLIQLIFTVVSVLIIGYWQHRQIKTLKSEINSYKGIIESLQTYMSIFDMDEVQKHIQLRVDNKELEYRNILESQSNKDEQFNLYFELLGLCSGLLYILPKNVREKFLDKHIRKEKNKVAILNLIEIGDTNIKS